MNVLFSQNWSWFVFFVLQYAKYLICKTKASMKIKSLSTPSGLFLCGRAKRKRKKGKPDRNVFGCKSVHTVL